MNIVLFLAGGNGLRMGGEVPKQFIEVAGKPIVLYTLEALEAHQEVQMIRAVCLPGYEERLTALAERAGITKLKGVVTGGNSRYLSTRRGMESLQAAEDDVLIVHDSVRPLVTAAALTATIEVCRRYGNAMTILPCVDTMYERTTADFTSKEYPRDRLVRGQTPEAVTGRRMREMYAAADSKGIELDSISALQSALGYDIHFAPGDERNIKITRPEDLKIFKALLALKEEELS